MRPNPHLAIEPSAHSSSTEDDALLREFNEYVADPHEDVDSIDHMIEEDDDDDDVTIMGEIVDPSESVCQYERQGLRLFYFHRGCSLNDDEWRSQQTFLHRRFHRTEDSKLRYSEGIQR